MGERMRSRRRRGTKHVVREQPDVFLDDSARTSVFMSQHFFSGRQLAAWQVVREQPDVFLLKISRFPHDVERSMSYGSNQTSFCMIEHTLQVLTPIRVFAVPRRHGAGCEMACNARRCTWPIQ